MRFELFLAARYLRAKRRQALVGVVTAISVLGVAAGVASLIIALAITNGMRRDLQERLVGSTAHVELMRPAADGIKDWQDLLARLKTTKGVVAAAPGLYGQVLISRGARSGGALIKGVLPDDERTVSDLLQAVAQGSAKELAPVDGPPTGNDATPPIVIGKDLAESIGAHPGDTVLVTSPQGELTPLGIVPRYRRFQVVGIFASGFYQYDSTYTFIRLADAQRLFSEPDVISIISFKIKDLYQAAKVGKEIEEAAGPGFQTTNWMEQNRELFRALKLEQIVTFIVLALIVCVAALNILIALTMMVMEKTREIAVLMSFGVTEAQIRRIFLYQGFLISLTGTAIGLVVGYALSWAGGHYRFIPLDASVYSIAYLPFAPKFLDAVIVAGVSLSVSLIATLYPSRSAARVLPAEALRYE
ncbi:lipoprotein-releasing system permease protein [Granulicella pectinivorans]|uniref:Lipoprotein-releasing system permease protein n=1 Tax=Granulicella pectinivorans TaxID=474950 RepID=A0A1I6MER0_9BACT|nr:FtsX-like permease family protein [Granulicella pectinivorans]SFS14206.1 lipoprotein-releasing system permease protein [Granulicella pectinivorans]